MTLKDKLELEIMDLPLTDEVINSISNHLEHIADELAIGFTEWCLENDWQGINEETLEIYKKEKGL